jgi:hypothetical protein
LSEPTSTSDKISAEGHHFVRTRLHFGQNLYGEPLICPNPPPLRTKSLRRATGLSEPTSTSDKISAEGHHFVRTRLHFGQNLYGETPFCPNMAPLRTKSQRKDTVLSEHGSTLDKISVEGHHFVRTHYHFRQNHTNDHKNCPNSGINHIYS